MNMAMTGEKEVEELKRRDEEKMKLSMSNEIQLIFLDYDDSLESFNELEKLISKYASKI